MYLYEMTWIELYVDSSCPVCNKWLNLNRSEESLHYRLCRTTLIIAFLLL